MITRRVFLFLFAFPAWLPSLGFLPFDIPLISQYGYRKEIQIAGS